MLIKIPAAMLLTLGLLPSFALGLNLPERLAYDVTWKGIRAGSAVQEVTARGDDVYIVNSIKSSGLVSAFFFIDDKTESVISKKRANVRQGVQRFYRENINEGKTHTHKEARFDHINLKVHVKDLRTNSEKVDPISPATYDSLSSIYFVRSTDLVPGQTICLDIYDFKRLWNNEVRVLRREEIDTQLGTFKTLVVTSQLSYSGVPSPAGNTTIWLTDDSRRIPVKITTTLKVGELTLTLVGGSYWPVSRKK